MKILDKKSKSKSLKLQPKEEILNIPPPKKIYNNKIIIETSADLYKLPRSVLKSTKLYNFSGKYFEQMYEELLKAENSGDIQKLSNYYTKPIISNKKELKVEKILFNVICHGQLSNELGVIGSINELGNWNEDKVIKMEFENDQNAWRVGFILNNEEDFEYKFLFLSGGRVKKWEDGNNRIFKCSYVQKLIENNLKGEYAHLDDEHESYDYYLDDYLLIINCFWNQK